MFATMNAQTDILKLAILNVLMLYPIVLKVGSCIEIMAKKIA